MGVVYYIDNVNGTDASSGLREPTTSHNYVDSSAANTETVCAALLSAADDYYNGATIWNRTRGAGAIVSDYTGLTKTLTHGAIAGHVATDEFYLVNAWKTLSKAATTCAVGDIAYYRAGQTETLAVVVNFTNDGTTAEYISIIGMGTGSATLETTDGTATEAWHDASTTRPIIDGNNGNYYINLSGDDFWQLKNLDIRNTNSNTAGCLHVSSSSFNMVNCIVRDSAHASGFNLTTASSTKVTIENCQLKNANNINLRCVDSIVFINNTTFDSGALGTLTGMQATESIIYLNGCVFGGTSAHVTNDIVTTYPETKTYATNCKIDITKVTFAAGYYVETHSPQFFGEDHNQVYGAQVSKGFVGVTERVTDVIRSGGATSSVKIVPSAYVGLLRPFILQDFPKPTWQVWLPAGAATLTVYVRGLNWASYPTAAQLYLEAEYVTDDTTGAITRSTVVSDEVLTDNTTWVGLQCAVNPHVASFVDLKLYLGLYEDATTGVYVDIKPVIS